MSSSSLIEGDVERRQKLLAKLNKLGPWLGILAYVAGIVYFGALPRTDVVHRTYMSENALSPGVAISDLEHNHIIMDYYRLIKSHYENKTNEFDLDLVRDLFANHMKLETYVQHFNVCDPFSDTKSDHIERGRNVYAFGRSRRADGTESIVVTAPLHVNKKSKASSMKVKKELNLIGITNLFVMAHLVKYRPYWAKDIIFVVSDVDYYGTQAWLNSYYNIKTEYLEVENLYNRGGAIQAALNLEFPDGQIENMYVKLEGANGKLPNLDLHNTIFQVCQNQLVKCNLATEKYKRRINTYNHETQEFVKNDFEYELRNMVAMVFSQASGVPSASHGYFLEHRIESVTLKGVVPAVLNKKYATEFRRIMFCISRTIEATLRSINNLQERFHQSFFFYLLPTHDAYVSIAMYMPAFGLVCLPLLIKVIQLWCSIFFREKGQQDSSLSSVFSVAISSLLIAFGAGALLHFETKYFIQIGNHFDFNEADTLFYLYASVVGMVLLLPLVLRQKQARGILELSGRMTKLFNVIALLLFVGNLSLFNFSSAFLTAVFYVPVALVASIERPYRLVKPLQIILVLLACPLIYLSALYAFYLYFYENSKLVYEPSQLLEEIKSKLYQTVVLSKISNIWTVNMVNLCLIPIWSSMWLVTFE